MNKLELIVAISLSGISLITLGTVIGYYLGSKKNRDIFKEMYQFLEKGNDIKSRSVYHHALMVLFNKKK